MGIFFQPLFLQKNLYLNSFLWTTTYTRQLMLKTFLSLCLLSCSLSAFCQAPQLQPSPQGAEVNFIAEAQLTVPNNVATIVVSAHAESHDLTDAQSEVNGLMNEATEALKKFPSKVTFKTLNYNVRPLYGKSEFGSNEITGWEASQRMLLTTEDIEGVPALAQLAQNNGLALASVSYSLTSETWQKTNETLIAQVIDNANKKAADIAQAMDMPASFFTLEKLEFEETGNHPRPMLLAARTAGTGEGTTMPAFEAGTTEVHKTARVSLRLKPLPG